MPTKLTDLLTHGSKTRRVHEIIEEMCDALGRLPTYQEVAERYASEGGNENTARTQYAHWKRMQLAGPASDSDAAANPQRHVTPFEHDARADIGPIPLTIDDQGRLSLPGELCAAMLLGPDGRVTARVEGGELRVIAPRVAIHRAQAIVRKHVKPGVSMVDEFLAERRKMWGDE
jgi:hypothetical protein